MTILIWVLWALGIVAGLAVLAVQGCRSMAEYEGLYEADIDGQWRDTHWNREIHTSIYGDPHISGCWGFILFDGVGAAGDFRFDSGLVYSSRENADQAAGDAAHVAWQWQGHCWE